MKEYIRYLRDASRVPYGVIVATSCRHVGWSLCNPVDHFDKKLGKRIARNRMKKADEGLTEIVDRHRARCDLRDLLSAKKYLPADRLFAMLRNALITADYLDPHLDLEPQGAPNA